MDWRSQEINIKKLIPLKNNPRKITKKEFEELERDPNFIADVSE